MQCDCPIVQSGPTLSATCGGGAYMLFMGLLEVLLKSQCDLEDPCGRPKLKHNEALEYDFIVIGGGSAGCAVAARLSEISSWRVLLIEAGPDEPTGTQVPSMFLNYLGSSIDWGYKTEPEQAACLGHPEQRCSWPRGKVLGGTSVINGMMYIRGAKKDYDDWAASGLRQWSYEQVLPYFLKSEDNKQIDQLDYRYHSTGGPLTVQQFPYHPPMSNAILKAAEELGYPVRDLNGEYHAGFNIAQSMTRYGSRVSSAKAFIRPASKRPNLNVMLNTTVLKVLIDENKSAYGVEIRNAYGKKQIVRAKNEVILSAGAVGSPQLLLLSGIGPVDDLRRVGVAPIHHLPGVGKNLHNHVAYFLSFTMNDTDTLPLNWATATEYLLFRDGLMSGTGLSAVTGFVHSRYSDTSVDHPDLQIFFSGFLADCAKTGQIGELKSPDKRTMSIFPVVLHPKSRGYLTLATNNPDDHPKIYANYLTHPDDVKVLIDGIKTSIKMSQTSALKNYGLVLDKTPAAGCEKIEFGSDDYWECAIRRDTGPENHQVGSCKMGPVGDENAVVNEYLQVNGVQRLRVADASVIPKILSGNIAAPAIMIGERVADMIKSTWTEPLAQNENSVNSFFKRHIPNQDEVRRE